MKAINDLERAVLCVVRANQAEPKTSVRREWSVLGRRVVYERRRPNAAWGRFGGGWNWVVGAQIGGGTVILNLLVATLRIDRRRK